MVGLDQDAGLKRAHRVHTWKGLKNAEKPRTSRLMLVEFANAEVRDQLLARAGLVYDGTDGGCHIRRKPGS